MMKAEYRKKIEYESPFDGKPATSRGWVVVNEKGVIRLLEAWADSHLPMVFKEKKQAVAWAAALNTIKPKGDRFVKITLWHT